MQMAINGDGSFSKRSQELSSRFAEPDNSELYLGFPIMYLFPKLSCENTPWMPRRTNSIQEQGLATIVRGAFFTAGPGSWY